ncbi:hypothetical protein THRCLA_22134 [Thraustotheca clavata]|uniref:tRNA-intron lyase n=1 Tax=Thraustotheca clavata TaxID=74557 RepID=A0A1V9ZBU5_9STRA|nr:hypothetical protein THRCLA_22134 [Thraustotheca clavata]
MAKLHEGQSSVSVLITQENESFILDGRFGSINDNICWLLPIESMYLASIERLEFEAMTVKMAWITFIKKDATFVSRYALYHHYRAQGWIVQSGLAYGTVYALYRFSPNQVHSEYLVHFDPANKPMSWSNMQMLTRLSEDVKKTILLCQLHFGKLPENAIEIKTPHVTVGISEIMFRYWSAQCLPEISHEAYIMQPSETILKRKRR